MATQPQLTVAPFARGITRSITIASSLLGPDDLRRLYRLLEVKAKEAADRQVSSLTLQPAQTPQQFAQLCQQVRDSLALVVRIQTRGGEWVTGASVAPLENDELPDGIERIEFESCFFFRSQTNLWPNNHFTVSLDLHRTSVQDLNSNLTLNASVATVSGLDATWVGGVCAAVENFVAQRRTKRGWLHFARSYDVLMLLVGFPVSFFVVYHIDHAARQRLGLSESLAAALYVYVVLTVLFFFRLAFNYARWIFPKVELDAPRQHVGRAHRVAISVIALMIVSALVASVLKILGLP